MAIPETPGERLKARMKEIGVGNAEVAAAAKVHVKTVSQWLNDRFPGGPSDENLRPVAALLRTSVAWIRYGTENTTTSSRADVDEAELPRQLQMMVLDFEREALEKGADKAFMRYVRNSFRDPDYVALFGGGPDESPMTAEEARDEMKAHINELRAILKRRIERLAEDSGRLAPDRDR